MGERTRSRSRKFWQSADEQERKRTESAEPTARRFPSRAWDVDVTLLADNAAIKAKLTELSESGVRLIVPRDLGRDAEVSIRIEDPEFHEVFERDATVAWSTPPPPVGTTWVVWAEFAALTRDQVLRLAKWRLHYTSKEIETALRLRQDGPGPP